MRAMADGRRVSMKPIGSTIDRLLDAATRWGAWLVLPLSLLLCIQWPLRDWVAAGSRQANDMAQWLFAVYVALALRHTTRVHGHIAADTLAARYAPALKRTIARWGTAACLLPWAAFVLISGAAPAWQSLRSLERFPDTQNPLYFVVKCSVWLLALLIALQSIADLLRPDAEA